MGHQSGLVDSEIEINEGGLTRQHSQEKPGGKSWLPFSASFVDI